MLRLGLIAAVVAASSACTQLPRVGDPAPPAPPAPPASSRSCTAPAQPARGTALVYLLRPDADYSRAARPSEYAPQPRPLTEAEARAPLRAALTELLRGPTRAERRRGCLSAFSGHAHLLRSVEIEDGEAVIDFRGDLTGELGTASTLTGGTIFITQLVLTARQFPAVRSVRLELEGSCDALLRWMQAVGCQTFR